ncbi:hypothetical protein BGY98DRAFT_1096900 [Russula aff. rugulosa BPL654]|nr:hypothetical protein BGY98DRAFT_1096900 [Russula aff. rugulosa BPL654]
MSGRTRHLPNVGSMSKSELEFWDLDFNFDKGHMRLHPSEKQANGAHKAPYWCRESLLFSSAPSAPTLSDLQFLTPYRLQRLFPPRLSYQLLLYPNPTLLTHLRHSHPSDVVTSQR